MNMVKSILPLIITAVVLCMAPLLHAEEPATLPSAATPEATTQSVDDMADYRRLGWEWFGIKMGSPFLIFLVEDINRGNFFCTDIILPTFRWKHAYYTVAELHIGMVFGDFGISTGGGYRLALGDNLDYEMRFGASLGYRTKFIGEDNALTPAPHIQIIANYNHASFGLGLELPLYLHLTEHKTGLFEVEGHWARFQMELFLYFRVTVF